MKIFRCKKKNKITTNRNEIQQRRGFCDYNHSNFLHKNLFRVQIITKKNFGEIYILIRHK